MLEGVCKHLLDVSPLIARQRQSRPTDTLTPYAHEGFHELDLVHEFRPDIEVQQGQEPVVERALRPIRRPS